MRLLPHGWSPPGARLAALLVSLAAAVTFSGGCGQPAGEADCITDCNFQKASCGFEVADCAAQCSNPASDAASAGCASQFESYMSCLASHPVCGEQPCPEQHDALDVCVMPWCDANHGAVICGP